MNTIKLFKLNNGEMVVAEIEETREDGGYCLSYPLTIVPIPPEQVRGMTNQIGFMKAMPFSDYSKPIVLHPHSISIDSNADKNISAAYQKQVTEMKSKESGIVMADSIPSELLKKGAAAKDFSKLNM